MKILWKFGIVALVTLSSAALKAGINSRDAFSKKMKVQETGEECPPCEGDDCDEGEESQ